MYIIVNQTVMLYYRGYCFSIFDKKIIQNAEKKKYLTIVFLEIIQLKLSQFYCYRKKN